jgi:hypothetical protein
MSRPARTEVNSASRGTRLFIAALMVSVPLIYGVALAIGGGFASPPFPPDLPSGASRLQALPAAPIGVTLDAAPQVAREFVPASSDIAPPWTFDAEGRAQFTTR